MKWIPVRETNTTYPFNKQIIKPQYDHYCGVFLPRKFSIFVSSEKQMLHQLQVVNDLCHLCIKNLNCNRCMHRIANFRPCEKCWVNERWCGFAFSNHSWIWTSQKWLSLSKRFFILLSSYAHDVLHEEITNVAKASLYQNPLSANRNAGFCVEYFRTYRSKFHIICNQMLRVCNRCENMRTSLSLSSKWGKHYLTWKWQSRRVWQVANF